MQTSAASFVTLCALAMTSCAGSLGYGVRPPTPSGAVDCPTGLAIAGNLRAAWLRCDPQRIPEGARPATMAADARGVVLSGRARFATLALPGFPTPGDDAGYVAAFDPAGKATMLWPAPFDKTAFLVVLGPNDVFFLGQRWSRPTGQPRTTMPAAPPGAFDPAAPERALSVLFPFGPRGHVVADADDLGPTTVAAVDGGGRVLIALHEAHDWSKDAEAVLTIVDASGQPVLKRPHLFRRMTRAAGLPQGGFVVAGVTGRAVEIVTLDAMGREVGRSAVAFDAEPCDARHVTPCIADVAIDPFALFVLIATEQRDVLVHRLRGAERASARFVVPAETSYKMWGFRVAPDGAGGAYVFGALDVHPRESCSFLARFPP